MENIIKVKMTDHILIKWKKIYAEYKKYKNCRKQKWYNLTDEDW